MWSRRKGKPVVVKEKGQMATVLYKTNKKCYSKKYDKRSKVIHQNQEGKKGKGRKRREVGRKREGRDGG